MIRKFRICPDVSRVAIAAGVGAALGVSNGPATGIAVGAALFLAFSLRPARNLPKP